MRIILVLITTFSLTNCLAQDIQKTKERIDGQVAIIEHGIKTKSYSFTKKENKKLLHYTYLVNSEKVLMITRSFGENNDSVKQVFYYNKDKLIYSTESIISYYTTDNVRDSIGWGGNYYFSNNKLIDLVTLGHGKSEEDSWDPEKEVLTNSNHARRDVMKNRIKK